MQITLRAVFPIANPPTELAQNTALINLPKLFQHSFTFTGCLINGLPMGAGTFINSDLHLQAFFIFGQTIGIAICKTDKSTYTGPINHDLIKNGVGKILFKDGTLFEGEFKNNQYHGKGKFSFADGKVYEGDFQHNTYNGKGKLIGLNSIFEGDYKNGVPNGRGCLIYHSGPRKGDKIEGDFLDGLPNGRIKYSYSNGDIYEGDAVNGYIKGKGRLICKDGKIYDGEFDKDIYPISGTLYLSSSEKYEGGFLKGQPHGPVKYINNDKVFQTHATKGALELKGTITCLKYKYEGEIDSEGLFHGPGKLITSNSTFEGFYIHGYKEGSGSYRCNSYSYKGHFQRDNFHGMGEYTFQDGLVLEGIFKDGYYPNISTLHYPNGDIYKGQCSGRQKHGKGDYYNHQTATWSTSIYEHDQLKECLKSNTVNLRAF